ncbi:MAG: septum formation initiator family protein [Minisyncoccia bacterium]
MYRYMKIIFVLQILIIFYLGFLIIKEKISNAPLKKDYEMYENLVKRLERENESLKRRLNYLENPENLKKELKDKFNLVEEGEKVIIFPKNY